MRTFLIILAVYITFGLYSFSSPIEKNSLRTVDSLSYLNGNKQWMRNCAICHSDKKDHKLVSISLKNILAERGNKWIFEYTQNEKRFIETERAKYNNTQNGRMEYEHDFKLLSSAQINDILYYILKKE